MRLPCAPAKSLAAATPGAALFNEGLAPGLRVTLDDRDDQTATICFVESESAYTCVRLDRDGQRIRLESWRLAIC